jgi:hypothetical protein
MEGVLEAIVWMEIEMQISTRKKPTCRLGRALETESASLPRF